MKSIEPGDVNRNISIINDRKEILGYLVPIGPELARQDGLAAMLCRWRQRVMGYYLTQFKATPERTLNWLQQIVTLEDNRLLFLIMTEENKMIGHIGLCNIASDNVEIDNLVRGEPGGDPKLIFYAEIAVLDWIIRVLQLKNIYLRQFTDNHTGTALHKSIGFFDDASWKIIKSEINGECQHEIIYDEAPAKGERGYMRMVLDVEDYRNKFSWLSGKND
jgi:hypothetical protein